MAKRRREPIILGNFHLVKPPDGDVLWASDLIVLKSRHYLLAMLMWCAALDALVVAERRDVFERRIVRLLGSSTFVFPFGERGFQPPYTVGQLAGNLYELRGIVAHGYEIPRKFRGNVGFNVGDTVSAAANISWDCQYRELLSEAALFMLCSVLRRIFELDLIGLVRKSKAWKRYLDQTVIS